MNGLWLLLLLGRWSMVTGWKDMFSRAPNRNKREFVSVDARLDDLKKDTRSYEMLSRDTGKTMDDVVTPSLVSPLTPIAKTPISPSGRRTPDYFNQSYGQNYGQTARYHTPARSFSSPRPPQSVTWDARETYARNGDDKYEKLNPLGMNRI